MPRTLAEIRLQSYQEYAWPRALGAAFTRHNLLTGLGLAAVLSAIMAVAAPGGLSQADGSADFYAVVPHGVMVSLFGIVFRLRGDGDGGRRHALRARRSRRLQSGRVQSRRPRTWRGRLQPAHHRRADASPSARQRRRLRLGAKNSARPWRRWLHHCTFYGFLLCFASTTVAALYHNVFGWRAPYAYTSLPVVLGTVGGVGLLVGLARPVDPAVAGATRRSATRRSADWTSRSSRCCSSPRLTGLALLVLRHEPAMPWLLIVHLGTVLALFVTLPYGKFVHGLYRGGGLLA